MKVFEGFDSKVSKVFVGFRMFRRFSNVFEGFRRLSNVFEGFRLIQKHSYVHEALAYRYPGHNILRMHASATQLPVLATR